MFCYRSFKKLTSPDHFRSFLESRSILLVYKNISQANSYSLSRLNLYLLISDHYSNSQNRLCLQAQLHHSSQVMGHPKLILQLIFSLENTKKHHRNINKFIFNKKKHSLITLKSKNQINKKNFMTFYLPFLVWLERNTTSIELPFQRIQPS